MEIQVDLTTGHPVQLRDATDFKRFSVVVSGVGTDADVAGVLARNGAGPLDPAGEGHVYVATTKVRDLALLEVADTTAWNRDFDAMLDYARSKGWLDATGSAIKAHIEWQDATPVAES